VRGVGVGGWGGGGDDEGLLGLVSKQGGGGKRARAFGGVREEQVGGWGLANAEGSG